MSGSGKGIIVIRTDQQAGFINTDTDCVQISDMEIYAAMQSLVDILKERGNSEDMILDIFNSLYL